MTTKDISGVVTWLKGWFYDKGEVNNYLNAKLNNNLTNANMNVVTDSSGNVVTEAKPTPYSHPSTHATTMIKEGSALGNIGTSANATQHDINDAVNTAIGQLKGIEFIKVVSNKGTASADTMNKLYIVSENNKVNVYYTKASGSGNNITYSWAKMDTDILDEFSVSWNDLTSKPDVITDIELVPKSTDNTGAIKLVYAE